MNSSTLFIEQELSLLLGKILETRKLMDDPVFAEEAKLEIARLESQRVELTKALEDPVSQANSGNEAGSSGSLFANAAILEVRGAVGGEEAKIWAQDLLRMYTRFANTRGYKVAEIDEDVIKITAKGAYDIFKYETGVHRVQRVPETESQGRIHTSTASVVVLPQVPETAVVVREDDLEWSFTRSGGHGGQNVNKVATAVRLTHTPSGIAVQCRTERSQEQNRKLALDLLRAELWEMEEEKKQKQVFDQRSVIGRSMRAEKIRTYNYPRNQVTDHRIGKSWHSLDRIMEGDLGEMMETVIREIKI